MKAAHGKAQESIYRQRYVVPYAITVPIHATFGKREFL
jgi:hypothetical protein